MPRRCSARQKRILAELLNLAARQAERLELRGTIEETRTAAAIRGPELIQIALESARRRRLPPGSRGGPGRPEPRPGQSVRGRLFALSAVHLSEQRPYRQAERTSWALGITVPLPVYNRNQGNIERARINVYQSEVQLRRLEHAR